MSDMKFNSERLETKRESYCGPDLAMVGAGVERHRHQIKQLVRRLLQHVRRQLKIARKDAGAPLLVLLYLGTAQQNLTLCVYLLRENPLGPGRQHTRLDFMAGRLGPGVGGRVGGGAARGAGFAVGGV